MRNDGFSGVSRFPNKPAGGLNNIAIAKQPRELTGGTFCVKAPRLHLRSRRVTRLIRVGIQRAAAKMY